LVPFAQLTPVSACGVGEAGSDQVWPASLLCSIVPRSPTATQSAEIVQLVECSGRAEGSYEGVGAVPPIEIGPVNTPPRRDQDAPSSFDAKIAPRLPTATHGPPAAQLTPARS